MHQYATAYADWASKSIIASLSLEAFIGLFLFFRSITYSYLTAPI